MKPTLALIYILLGLTVNTTQCQETANSNNTLPLIQLLDATDRYIENRGPALLAIEEAILAGNVLEKTLISAGLEEIKSSIKKNFQNIPNENLEEITTYLDQCYTTIDMDANAQLENDAHRSIAYYAAARKNKGKKVHYSKTPTREGETTTDTSTATEDTTRDIVISNSFPTNCCPCPCPTVYTSTGSCPSSTSAAENITLTGELHTQAATAGGAHVYSRPENGLHDTAVLAFNFQKNGMSIPERKNNGAYGSSRIRLQGNTYGRIFFDTTDDALVTSDLTQRASLDKDVLKTEVPVHVNNVGYAPAIPLNSPMTPRMIFGQIEYWADLSTPILSNTYGLASFQPQSVNTPDITITFAQPFSQKPAVFASMHPVPTERNNDFSIVIREVHTTHAVIAIYDRSASHWENRNWHPISFFAIGI